MNLDDLSFDRREGNLRFTPEESFIDIENIENESEEYRKSVAKWSAGAIIGCFVSGGIILTNYLNFQNNFIYALAGAGFVLSLGVGFINFKRDFEITKHWYDR